MEQLLDVYRLKVVLGQIPSTLWLAWSGIDGSLLYSFSARVWQNTLPRIIIIIIIKQNLL